MKSRRGSAILEAVLFIPILTMLLYGMIEFARIGWTYFTLQKVLFAIARAAGTAQGINFCDAEDPLLADAKNLAIFGAGSNASSEPIVLGLTAAMVRVRVERVSTDDATLGACDCSATGCDAAQGGRGPDFIVVDLADGYSMRTNIPFVASENFPLRPLVRVPYGGL